MTGIEAKVSAYCDLLMERESAYRKVGDTLERPIRFIPKYAEVVYQG